MSSMEQQDERRILGQMVRFQNQAAVRIDNDCVNGLGGTSLRSQGQEKENKGLFHVPLFDTSKPLHVYADTGIPPSTTPLAISFKVCFGTIVVGGTAALHACRVWGGGHFFDQEIFWGGGTAGENDRPSATSHAYAPRCGLASAISKLHRLNPLRYWTLALSL